MTNVVEHEIIEKVPAKAEVVAPDAPAKSQDTPTGEVKPEPVAKVYSQAEVDEITKKVKDNARRKRDEARNEASALRRILMERGNVEPPRPQSPQYAQPQQSQADEPVVPQREQYADDSAYFQAVIDYRADLKVREHIQRHARQSAEQNQRMGQEQLERTFNANQEKARSKYEDFDDVVYDTSLPPLHPVVVHAIKALENGPELIYAIGKNRAEAMRLAQMHPILALKELGKIEAKLATPSAPAGTPASAPAAKKPPLPAPLNPVTPRDSKPDSDDPSDSDDDATWLKKRNKQLREQGRR